MTWTVLSSSSSEASLARASSFSACRCLPGDPCWPSADDWAKLNATLRGRLIETVPLSTVCHDPNYDAAKCAALKAGWEDPSIQ